MLIFKKKLNVFIAVTAIFGDYDILHKQPDLPNVKYVCITDNPERLKNNSYNYCVIDYKNFKDIKPNWSPRKKTYFIRYNLLKIFKDTKYIIWHDADLLLNKTVLNYYLNMCNNTQYEFFYLSNFNFGYDIKNYFKYSPWITQSVFKYNIQKNFYEKNKEFIHKNEDIKICHGKFRIIKNTLKNNNCLEKIYNFLTETDNTDFIFILDEPITGIFLENNKINKFDISLDNNWYKQLLDDQKLSVFYHNSDNYRFILSNC